MKRLSAIKNALQQTHYQTIIEYCALTGRAPADVVDEALENYIEADITSHLEGLSVRMASA